MKDEELRLLREIIFIVLFSIFVRFEDKMIVSRQ